jgi:hypothetical protein
LADIRGKVKPSNRSTSSIWDDNLSPGGAVDFQSGEGEQDERDKLADEHGAGEWLRRDMILASES